MSGACFLGIDPATRIVNTVAAMDAGNVMEALQAGEVLMAATVEQCDTLWGKPVGDVLALAAREQTAWPVVSICFRTITDHPDTPMPDPETNVLLALADGTTCEGFLDPEPDRHVWRDVTADELDDGAVVAWADMPVVQVPT